MSKKEKVSSVNLSEKEEIYFKKLVPLADRAVASYSSYGTLYEPSHPKNYTFIGFEIEGYETPKSIKDYFILLATIAYDPRTNNKESLLKLIKERQKDPKNMDNIGSANFMVTAKTLSVYQKPDGTLEKITQSNHGRGRSIEDVYCIIKHKFKSLTFRQFYNMLINSINFFNSNGGFSVCTQYAYACSTISKIRVGYSSEIIIPNLSSSRMKPENCLCDIEEKYIIDFYKKALVRLVDIENINTLTHEELKDLFTKHYLLSSRRPAIYKNSGNYNSKFTHAQMYERFADPKSKLMEIHARKVALKYIR